MKNKNSHTNKKLKKLNAWLHLWLGLFSGIIVVIVGLTGCLWVFEEEILNTIEPWRFVEPQEQIFLPPSRLIDIAESAMQDSVKATGISYNTPNESAAVGFFHKGADGGRGFTAVFINPYSGEVLKKDQLIGSGKFQFFEFIANGHRALWLPYEIGRPLVGIGTLIFLILLITGIIMWWPKNFSKKNLDKSFKISWKAKFKRLNYDLHNVLGFYAVFFSIALAVTGLVMSFSWFSDGLYWLAAGGKTPLEEVIPSTDTTAALPTHSVPAIDRAWLDCTNNGKDIISMFVDIPQEPEDPFEFVTYYSEDSFYKRDVHFYDQRTVENLNHLANYAGKYENTPFSEKLKYMNYDIHIGVIWGLPGKILAFFVSLIITTLPITGFIIWLKPKKKKKRTAKPPSNHIPRNGNISTSRNIRSNPKNVDVTTNSA